MTGLDPTIDELVEVAVVVTGPDLVELDEGVTVVIKPSDAAFENMNDFVVGLHTASGLLEEIPGGTDLETAQAQVLAYITKHVPVPRKAPLAGSSVYVDRGFLAKYMPAVDAHMHYRVVDVSSFKELIRRWYPRVYFAAPEKRGNHRALADIRESIAEMRYYRATVMVAEPGPDTAAAREIAADHLVDHGTDANPHA
jgi:oligoribonuclease